MEGKKKKAAPKKRAVKKDKTVDYTADYSIEHNVEDGEVDLHFNLANPTEDRFFAYSLTLMDLFQTLEGIKKVAPPEVVEDFIAALKVLKGMSESIKLKVEVEAGLITADDADEIVNGKDEKKPTGSAKIKQQERIKKMLETIKEKLQKKHPGAKVVIGKVSHNGSGQSMEDALKDAMNQISREMNDDEEEGFRKPLKRKKDKLVRDEGPSKRGNSQDLEI